MDWQHSPDVQVAVDHLEKNGMFTEYEIIGSLKYEALEHSNTQIESSNEFILRKKPSKEKPLSEIKPPVEKPCSLYVASYEMFRLLALASVPLEVVLRVLGLRALLLRVNTWSLLPRAGDVRPNA
jgi:hypothetical protein